MTLVRAKLCPLKPLLIDGFLAGWFVPCFGRVVPLYDPDTGSNHNHERGGKSRVRLSSALLFD